MSLITRVPGIPQGKSLGYTTQEISDWRKLYLSICSANRRAYCLCPQPPFYPTASSDCASMSANMPLTRPRRDMCPRVQIGCCTWRYAFVSKNAFGKFALRRVVCELYREAEQTGCGHGDLLWLCCKSNARNKRGLLLLFMLTCPGLLWRLKGTLKFHRAVVYSD
jgi:hypothetical protein